MRKIPTVFMRDFDNEPRYVLDRVTPGCEWVLAGEGIATRKYDGTCVMFDGALWWARREVKSGKGEPPGWRPEGESDPNTGKRVGWEPAERSSFAKYLAEAIEVLVGFGGLVGQPVAIGTYELVGPRINGNPERATEHRLHLHARAEQFEIADLSYGGLRKFMNELKGEGIEGVVWHHPDGRMAKLKVRDFDVQEPAQ